MMQSTPGMKTGWWVRMLPNLPPMVYEVIGYDQEFRALEKETPWPIEYDSNIFLNSLADILGMSHGSPKSSLKTKVFQKEGFWRVTSPRELIAELGSENVSAS